MRQYQTILTVFAIAAALAATGCPRRDTGPSTEARVYELGQKVTLGHIIYTVYETQWLNQLGVGSTARIPQNRYFLVRISAANSGSNDELVPTATVEDDQGTSYSEQSNGENVPQWIGFLRQVKPAESLQGNLVFDAPPKHYRMRVSDENGEKSALIDIPLKFETGFQGPQVPENPPGGAAPVPVKKP